MRWFAFALAALACAPCAALSAEPRNLIPDPGFERGLGAWQAEQTLLDDPAAAHTGRNCLFGKVDRPNTTQFLRCTFSLKENCVYRLVVWARSPEQSKIAVWLDQGNNKQLVTHWDKIARTWRKYEVRFSPPASGRWTLRIVAPSAFNAVPGTMYLDDIALYEEALPKLLNISQGLGFSELPALAAASDGSLWCAWQSYKNGADALWVALLQAVAGNPGEVKLVRKWPVELPRGAEVMYPALAAGAGGVWLACSVEVGDNWDIYAAPLSASGPGKLLRVTSDPAVDIKPALAALGDEMWVAWESNRDGLRQVYAKRIGGPGEPQRLCQSDIPSYSPSLASDGAALWAAWDGCVSGNYDVFAARYEGRRWDKPRRLSANLWTEHRPRLALRRGVPWLVWEAGVLANYRTNAFSTKRVCLAQLDAQGLRQPRGAPAALGQWVEKPSIVIDRLGRVWVAARQSKSKNDGWFASLWVWSGERWETVGLLTAKLGRSQPIALAALPDRIVAAIQADNIPTSYKSVEESKSAKSDILIAAVALSEAPAPSTPQLEPLALPEVEFDIVAQRSSFGEDAPARTISYQGHVLHLYFGDFHDHSDISRCNRRGDLHLNDNYAHNRDIHRLNFAAITDHGYNLSPPMWHLLQKAARFNTDPGRFVCFLGEEWTSTFEQYSKEHPYGFYGHRNLILADPRFPQFFNARNYDTPAQVWEKLRRARANFVHIPHQLADVGNVPTDWSFVDEQAQPVAEIFQNRGSYEYEGAPRQAVRSKAKGHFIQDAWAQGVVIGVIASPDHGGGHGKAAVFAPALTREALLDAIRARHTYGTTGAKIFLDVRVNGHLMGEKAKREGGPVTVEVVAIGAGPLARVDICRNNQFIYSREIGGKEARLQFKDTKPLPGTSYYYVRVIQEDEEIAWSSPVWLVAG